MEQNDGNSNQSNKSPPDQKHDVFIRFLRHGLFGHKEDYEVKNQNEDDDDEQVLKFISIRVNNVLVLFLRGLFFILFNIVVFYSPLHQFFSVHFMANFAFDCA